MEVWEIRNTGSGLSLPRLLIMQQNWTMMFKLPTLSWSMNSLSKSWKVGWIRAWNIGLYFYRGRSLWGLFVGRTSNNRKVQCSLPVNVVKYITKARTCTVFYQNVHGLCGLWQWRKVCCTLFSSVFLNDFIFFSLFCRPTPVILDISPFHLSSLPYYFPLLSFLFLFFLLSLLECHNRDTVKGHLSSGKYFLCNWPDIVDHTKFEFAWFERRGMTWSYCCTMKWGSSWLFWGEVGGTAELVDISGLHKWPLLQASGDKWP